MFCLWEAFVPDRLYFEMEDTVKDPDPLFKEQDVWKKKS
jgi:hypothetical protein